MDPARGQAAVEVSALRHRSVEQTALVGVEGSKVMSRFPPDFWKPAPIQSVGKLPQLRAQVIAQNERRMPKWKFRFAADFVCQIQPKVSEKLTELFECHAFEFPGADGKVFQSRTFARASGQWADCKFRIYWIENIGWVVKLTSAGAFRTIDPESSNPLSRTRLTFNVSDAVAFRERLVRFFDGTFFNYFAPGKMLAHNCMVCGKGLTDPASMARMIGPECYGSSGLSIPWLYGVPLE
jgi:hypothetical protein